MSTMHDEAKTIICKNCGYENSIQSKFCPNCGEKVASRILYWWMRMFCPNCGEKVVREDVCANCGTKIDPSLKFCQECGSKIPKFIALEQKVLEEWNMVRIPDNTTHKGLYFGKYQVTQAQWQSIMGNNPSYFTGNSSRPVEKVSWYDCQEFIEKLNALDEVKQAGLTFFLPTEEEWEYACRAGSSDYWGLLVDGRAGYFEEKRIQLDRSQMHGVYTICMAMCGSGQPRGTSTTTTVSAVGGTITLSFISLTIGTTATLTIGAAVLASASLPLGQENNLC